ncbi:unnamed protein product [Phytophthora fragariaefolia]|uniref:Unnamed protein product n=1 Tax=Phytophthora fragariaefolia TaxID=1490495 RepID=A0A9W7D353_9STRA|nr:unnamed protein product [Phytophthora fragariaefolia]
MSDAWWGRWLERAGDFAVDVPQSGSVRDLKQAIKSEMRQEVWDFADRLRVFVAFDERNDAVQGGRWSSEEDPVVAELLEGLIPEQVEGMLEREVNDSAAKVGTVLENAPRERTVHVLVKAPPMQIVRGDCVPCSCNLSPFFANLPAVDEVDGWLRFQARMPLTRARELFVRSSYKEIVDQVIRKKDPSRHKYTQVTGTPGNGKSVILFYVLWRLMKDMKRVLFLTWSPPIYFDGTSVWAYQTLPSSCDHKFWSPDLWCLVDSEDPTRIAESPITKCSVILISAPAASPQRDYIHGFLKLAPSPKMFYLPIWSKEELIAIAPLFPTTKVCGNTASNVWAEFLGTCFKTQSEETIDIGPFMRETVENMECVLEEYQLYVPKTPNHTPLDAWVPGFGGFKIVVDSINDIKPGTTEALDKLGPDGNCLYFVLPPKRYKEFTKKIPHMIEQFAVCIPFEHEYA